MTQPASNTTVYLLERDDQLLLQLIVPPLILPSMRKLYFLITLLSFVAVEASAGNPDRQGEAGAYELLLNPFARSAGLGSMNTSYVGGVEAMRINVAGIGRTQGLEIAASNMQYLSGTDISMTGAGFAGKLRNGQAISVEFASLSFGEIPVTTVTNPEGTVSRFSPTFFHIAIGYAKTFEEKISVGVGLRFISEAIYNASAFGFAFDAGVQYVSGEEDEFKLGVSLRNIGLGMSYSGDGIVQQLEARSGNYNISVKNRVADFELPFQLNIGASYDLNIDDDNMIVLLGNFTSNAFSRDNIGLGAEYGFRKIFMVRGGYNAEVGKISGDIGESVQLGLTAGASVAVPLGTKKSTELKRYLYVDYGYRATRVYNGNHNLGLRLNL